jgi:hypothetical protein
MSINKQNRMMIPKVDRLIVGFLQWLLEGDEKLRTKIL